MTETALAHEDNEDEVADDIMEDADDGVAAEEEPAAPNA